MAETASITAWITLFFGLYAIAAGTGELRQPGFWSRMLWEVERSKALQFLTGIICLALGATIYLVNPWVPSDWLSILITVLGGWMAIEGLLFLAIGDWFVQLARPMMGSANRIWAALAIAIGIGLFAIGLVRLQL